MKLSTSRNRLVFGLILILAFSILACNVTSEKKEQEICNAYIKRYKLEESGEIETMIELDGEAPGCRKSIGLNKFNEALQKDGRVTEGTELFYDPETLQLKATRDGDVQGDIYVNATIEIRPVNSTDYPLFFITSDLKFVRAKEEG